MLPLVIKCKPEHVKPIAHELIFKERYQRTVQNSFRFVFMSYLYHKGLFLRDLLSNQSQLKYNTVHNNLFINGNNTKVISGTIAQQVCLLIGVDFQYLYNIAVNFSKQTQYNSISFNTDGSPVFFKGFLTHFGC